MFVISDEVVDPEGSLLRIDDVVHGSIAVAIVAGQAYGVQDECTHQQCSLSEGFLDEFALICPCHQSVFDVRTGDVLMGPAATPLRTFVCDQENGSVRVIDVRVTQHDS